MAVINAVLAGWSLAGLAFLLSSSGRCRLCGCGSAGLVGCWWIGARRVTVSCLSRSEPGAAVVTGGGCHCSGWPVLWCASRLLLVVSRWQAGAGALRFVTGLCNAIWWAGRICGLRSLLVALVLVVSGALGLAGASFWCRSAAL